MLNPLALAVLLAAVAQEPEDNPIVRCQEALLERKVKNGEFDEKILEQAMTLPLKMPEIAVDKPAIRSLFERLGVDDFAQRQAATDELSQKHYAPHYLSELLETSEDPEVRFRAGAVLAQWKAHPPETLRETTIARQKVKMWYNLPACLAKLKAYRLAYDLTCKHDLGHQALYDICRGIRLDDVPPDRRKEFLRIALTGFPGTSHFLPSQMSRKDWDDTTLLDAIWDRLGDKTLNFDRMLFEQLLQHLPSDLRLNGWEADHRKGAIAAILVKAGNREALPDFIRLLNEEWPDVNVRSGSIVSGGHKMFFSPFNRFELLKLPAYRRFAPEILDGIKGKFDDRRIAIHEAYLNAVRPFADTEAGRNLLARLSTHPCPQTAIAASAMLPDPQALAAAVAKASGQDLVNTWHEIAGTLRGLRANMLLDPKEQARCSATMRGIVKHMIDNLDPSRAGDVLTFIHENPAPFDLPGVNRESILKLSSDPDSVGIRLLVEDARKRGDTAQLAKQLKTRDAAKHVAFLLHSGSKEALAPLLEETIRPQLAQRNCPSPITDAAWILEPDRMPKDRLPNAAQLFLLNTDLLDANKAALKLEPPKARLMRLSYGLEGADFDTYEPTLQGNHNRIFCEMTWTPRPPAEALKKKFLEHCERMHAMASDYAVSEFVEHAPGLLDRFGLELREEELNNPVATRVAAEAAFHQGDPARFRRLARKADMFPGTGLRYATWDGFEQRMMIMNLAQGRLDGVTATRLCDSSYSNAYRLTHLLYENGFAREAAAFRRLAREPGEFDRWDYAECSLVWAWNEAMAGNLEEAFRLSERALMKARSRELAVYAFMLRGLLKDKSPEFMRFLEILRLRRPFSRRARCQEQMAAFAAEAADADLKALSAFLAARMARALGKDPAGLWRLGADARGLHSASCKNALDALPEEKEEFSITSSWNRREPMGPSFTPFTTCVGICFKAKQALLAVRRTTWIDPYGIPSSVNRTDYFHNGSGGWVYISEDNQAKAWVPGEWTIMIEHTGGVEVHQRTLLPYEIRK